MKIFRTVLLPLALCILIFACGFFMPTLFGRLSPDLKDEIHDVEIAGMESPLYLENTADISLPPWDVIDTDEAVPFVQMIAPQLPEEVPLEWQEGNNRIAAWIANFRPDAAPAEATDFLNSAYVYEDNFIYLKDFRYSGSSNGEFILDLVLFNAEPLYLHIAEVGKDTAPVSDEDTFLADFGRFLTECPHIIYESEYGSTEDLYSQIKQAAELYPDSSATELIRSLGTLLTQENFFDEYWYSGTAYTWMYALQSCASTYTLTYNNETLLVLADWQNQTYSLFFDSRSGRMTGFSLDAAAMGYIPSRTPSPSEG